MLTVASPALPQLPPRQHRVLGRRMPLTHCSIPKRRKMGLGGVMQRPVVGEGLGPATGLQAHAPSSPQPASLPQPLLWLPGTGPESSLLWPGVELG